jgi:hypothetical protein
MLKKLLPKRIWLVNRDFQYRYTAAGVAAGLVSTSLTMALILYPLFVFKILTVGMFLPLPIIIAMVSAAVLNCVVQIFFGIILTHRIAGPMFSMMRQLRLIAMGKWRVTLRQRQGDELQPLARHLNEMSDGLVAIAKSDIQSLEEIKRSVLESQLETQSESGQDAVRKFDPILASIDRLIGLIKLRIRE